MGLSFDDALWIRFGERDVKLNLDESAWPDGAPTPTHWTPDRGVLRREITPGNRAFIRIPLREEVLRFPSAPIQGLHRLRQYHVKVKSQNLHTYRLLSHPGWDGQVSRIFLMHNGLNEMRKAGLYYQLASYLISQDRKTVCLLRPFPGHLTRSPFQGFAETPLDHYLWDGLHLFRQFLRYMIETKWLLSVIARRSNYCCVAGLNLLAANDHPQESRLEDDVVARAMESEWEDLHRATQRMARGSGSSSLLGSRPSPAVFDESVMSLRKALRLDLYPRCGGELAEGIVDPPLHVVGYSLGGFMAQSVFMAWPFLVSSCATLLSGGALRELAPTAFANPEEWQTVLHSLRYELDDALMDQRLGLEGDRVAGIEQELFLFLKRAFYEIFQQEYRGSFQTRLAAFRQRMLFMVGGNDPIVRPQSVLDSGPPDGINMIAIGGIGHFLEGGQRNAAEKDQLAFWLPEVGRTIGRLSKTAAERHRKDLASTWLDECKRVPSPALSTDGGAKEIGWLSVAERLEVEGDGALPTHLFQRCLDDLLARPVLKRKGLLFILRNEIPTFLLGEEALQKYAAASYHDDVSLTQYIQAVRVRQEAMKANRDRICVILPWNIEDITKNIDPRSGQASQSEASGGQMPWTVGVEAVWKDCMGECAEWAGRDHPDSVRVFDGRKGAAWGGLPKLSTAELAAAAASLLKVGEGDHEITPSLPDCWVWMSDSFLRRAEHAGASIAVGREQLCKEVHTYLRDSDLLADQLVEDHLRIITVSRARYNPRFRGRIVAEPKLARELLLHVALCVAMSAPFGNSKLTPSDG